MLLKDWGERHVKLNFGFEIGGVALNAIVEVGALESPTVWLWIAPEMQLDFSLENAQLTYTEPRDTFDSKVQEAATERAVCALLIQLPSGIRLSLMERKS